MRGKKPMTRRRRAMLRAGTLALLAAAFLLLGGYGFTPEAARQKSEKFQGVTGMEVLGELGELNMGEGRKARGWLMGNEEELMLCAVSHHWNSGWQPEGSMVLDCASKERTLFGGVWLLTSKHLDYGKDHFFLFGRVTDPDIVQVEIVVEITEKSDGKIRAKRTKWLREGMEQNFCVEANWMAWNVHSMELIGYDAGGREVQRTRGEHSICFLSEKGDGGHP